MLSVAGSAISVSSLLSPAVAAAFSVAKNKFVQKTPADAVNGVAVEIGDTKQTNFFTQAKLMKWQNEVNFSARLVEWDNSVPTITTKDDRIICAKPSYEVHFITAQDQHGHELHLLTKPSTNQFKWTLRTKSLRFYFHGRLDAQEVAVAASIAAGIPVDWSDPSWVAQFYDPTSRLDGWTDVAGPGVTWNPAIIGAYIARHTSKAHNFTGGKSYQDGNAFVIYPPTATDATGLSVQGEQIIVVDASSGNGVWTQTIPQAFLDSATYPVII